MREIPFMAFGKATLFSLLMVLILSGCEQRRPRFRGDGFFRPMTPRFKTITEAPSADSDIFDRTTKDKEGTDLGQNEAANFRDRLAIPTLPPIPADDDLFEHLEPFGDGPTLVPYARCGDGVKQALEQCEDIPHNDNNLDGCNIFCELPFCGNGVTEANEACDDANNVNGDGCSARCLYERCGNFRLDPGEQCDDGNLVVGDGCSACCKYEECGNKTVDPGEECDDGNLKNGDGCDDCCLRETPKKSEDEEKIIY
jgi:cysteine-rich repeat protein